MKNIKALFIITFLSLFITSCSEKEFLEEIPKDDVYAENLYLTYDGFTMGLNAAYAWIRDEYSRMSSSSSVSELGDPSSIPITNQLIWTIGTDNAFNSNGHSAVRWANWPHQTYTDDSSLEVIFLWLYRVINSCNMILTRAENPDVDWQGGSPAVDEERKNYVKAQALFIRAWAYRHLTYTWGDVPLSLDEINGLTYKSDWERTPVAEIREQMEEDLVFACDHLDWKYDNPSLVNKAVAQHYLAELHLATGEYDLASAEASDIINNSGYALVTSRFGSNAGNPGNCFVDLFRSPLPGDGNTESLWVFLNTEPENVTTGYQEYNYMKNMYTSYYSKQSVVSSKDLTVFYQYNGGKGAGRASITNDALSWWEDGDIRFDEFSWRKYLIYPSETVQGQIDTIMVCDTFPEQSASFYASNNDYEHSEASMWPSPTKWDYVHPLDANASSSDQYNDQIYLRLAETYLVLAEAQLMDPAQGPDVAAITLNVLRSRANASLITGADVDIDFILDERSRELYSEEHRRHHLLRTGKFLERVRAHNMFARYTLADYNVLLPIPQKVIDANTGLVMINNPGYDN